jgi:MFS family permease
MLRTAGTAAILGLLLAIAIGAVDAIMNSKGAQRLLRVLVCLGIGVVGGALSGLVGESTYSLLGARFIGWMLVGLTIGAAVGAFDLLRSLSAGQGNKQAVRKVINGVIGGALGGLIGGLLFDGLNWMGLQEHLPRTSLATGLVILGAFIGLLIGLAQVILKEAWILVESGFRPGRQLILSKPETTIGRGEGNDIGLFGDAGVDKQHARIMLKNNRYVLVDSGTTGGTFLNGEKLDGPTPLRAGDSIQVGKSVLRFDERQKR